MAVLAQTLLDQVEAAIALLVDTSSGIQSYSISTPGGGSETFTKTSLPELIAWRSRLKMEIAASIRHSRMTYGTRGNL